MLDSSPVSGSLERSSLNIRAAAKVNLGLEVLGKRADGYHELSTILMAVDLSDHLRLETAPKEISLRVPRGAVPEDQTNLAWRAALLLKEALGVERGVRITLRKTIPVAAGLGGGSSDAAALLAGLNRLWGLKKDVEFLRGLAVRLGMDVPFFLSGGTALATGRGEKLAPVRGAPTLTLVLVNPNFPLSTREVYQMVPESLRGDGSRIRELLEALRTGDLREVGKRLYNTLESVVEPRYPVIGEIKEALLGAGALGAALSGSGPTVFGIARSLAHAQEIRRALSGAPWSHFIVRTLTGDPIRFVRTESGRLKSERV